MSRLKQRDTGRAVPFGSAGPSDHQVESDTVVAIITPPGEGGIAAVRIAGQQSKVLLKKHFRPQSKCAPRPFLLQYGLFTDGSGYPVDEVTAVYMPEDHSYTGLEQVEIFCHGGNLVTQRILETLLRSGARTAEPGEFTKLAFLSGRIDLARAEGVAEIISAGTERSLTAARDHLLGAYSKHVNLLREHMVDIIAEVEASIDFPEETVEPHQQKALLDNMKAVIAELCSLVDSYRGGRILRDGFRIAIAGRPNAGKSSLFNLLLRQERALVTPQAGTTRDYLSEWIDLDGLAVNIIDTAGLHKGGGLVERAGHESARRVIKSADLVVWMVDFTRKSWLKSLKGDLKQFDKKRMLLVGNKIDLLSEAVWPVGEIEHNATCLISCKTSRGLKKLRRMLIDVISANMPESTSGLVVTSARHQQKLKLAIKAMRSGYRNAKSGASPEMTAFDLRQAAMAIDEITGRVYNEEILGKIFSRFCIGK